MGTESIADRVLQDILNVTALSPHLGTDAVTNAGRWRFLQHALQILEERHLLVDPADLIKAVAAPKATGSLDPKAIREGSKIRLEDGPEADANYVGEHSATPAPLDPSKVKAGDTVTLQRNSATFTGDVDDVATPSTIHQALSLAFYDMPGWFDLSGLDAWILTDHQPAPEPEPEWKPGYAIVRARGADADMSGLILNDGTFYGEEDGFLRTAEPGDYAVIRPLVVIDPAIARKAVVDALATVLPSATVDYEGLNAATDAVVAALGGAQ